MSKPISTLHGHSDPVWGVAFSPDGKTIASASRDSTIKLWNAATGEPIITLNGHRASVNSVAFSPNGKIIASASKDSTVQLWNIYPNHLKDLMSYSCNWLRAYLQSNPNVSDRTLCDDIDANSNRGRKTLILL